MLEDEANKMQTIFILMAITLAYTSAAIMRHTQITYEMYRTGLYTGVKYDGNEPELSPTQSYFVYDKRNAYHNTQYAHRATLNNTNGDEIELVWMCDDDWDTVDGFECIPTRIYTIILVATMVAISFCVIFFFCLMCCSLLVSCRLVDGYCCQNICSCFIDLLPRCCFDVLMCCSCGIVENCYDSD